MKYDAMRSGSDHIYFLMTYKPPRLAHLVAGNQERKSRKALEDIQ